MRSRSSVARASGQCDVTIQQTNDTIMQSRCPGAPPSLLSPVDIMTTESCLVSVMSRPDIKHERCILAAGERSLDYQFPFC